ncbi:antitoxin Xre/MbcA/ParS toxin-binding domain-containing protein [Rhizobium sp.]
MSSTSALRISFASETDADELSAALGISKRELAESTGVPAGNLNRRARANSAPTQNRLRETAEILNRVTFWAGGIRQAFAWYRSEPLSEFGGRTAESLVKSGKAAAVRDYLDHVALGGFA